jgi:hypothetical protein
MQLRLPVQTPAGVVEVNVAAAVETAEIRSTELIQQLGVEVTGMLAPKRGGSRGL